MKIPQHLGLTLPLAILLCCQNVHAQNLVEYPSFDEPDAASHWGCFVPYESRDKNCQFSISNDSPHSGASCGLLQSNDYARFCCVPKQTFSAVAGETYRVSVWVRGDGGTELQSPNPGAVLRIDLTLAGKESVGGSFFLGLNNKVTRTNLPPGIMDLPAQWTKMEGTFVVPTDADGFKLALFSWYALGRVYFDDLSLEKLSGAANK